MESQNLDMQVVPNGIYVYNPKPSDLTIPIHLERKEGNGKFKVIQKTKPITNFEKFSSNADVIKVRYPTVVTDSFKVIFWRKFKQNAIEWFEDKGKVPAYGIPLGLGFEDNNLKSGKTYQ